MTTIAYRDGIMAADSLITAADEWIMPYSVPKIRRLENGILVGFSGNLYLQEEFLRWLGGFAVPRPDLQDTSKAIAVMDNGEVWLHQYDGSARVKAPFYAIGCGMIPALAAMHMGADAKRAVEIAAILDNATGGEIQVERLSDEYFQPGSIQWVSRNSERLKHG